MKHLKLFAIFAFTAMMISCGGDKKTEDTTSSETTTEATESTENTAATDGAYDPKRGLGKYDASNVDVSTFNANMAAEGKSISDVKCASCHKTTTEKLVGPGWKGVTERHTPYWIMNFITNPDPMIDQDPEVQKQLEICLVRMPNQGLDEKEARSILEYMREIDGAK